MGRLREGHAAHRHRVLVAVMNSRRDFQIAHDHGWYRIPWDRAPRRIGADFLAFYQTGAFDEQRWAITYYSPITRYRLVSRRTLLPDEPDHPRADDLYYKIEIGPLLPLPHPIPSARLRRITFIPTTLERLLQAEEINDLWIGSSEEERLWLAFKERGLCPERRYPLREQNPEYCLDFALFCKEGKVGVCIEGAPEVENVGVVCERPMVEDYDVAALGWRLLRLGTAEVRTPQPSCVETVADAVEAYGGPLSGSQKGDNLLTEHGGRRANEHRNSLDK